MKTNFDLAKDILQTKTPYSLKPDDACSVYMLQRICSMATPVHNVLLNDLINTKAALFTAENEQFAFDLLRVVLPSYKRYIPYIKKIPNTPDKHKEVKELIAREWFLNLDEVDDILEINPNIAKVFEEKAKMQTK